MTRNTKRRTRWRIGLLGLCLLGVLVAGCSNNEAQEQSAPPSPAPTSVTDEPRPTGVGGSPAASQPVPESVDRANPDAVAEAALVTLYSYDTTIDTGPNDTARRALPWLSQSFADSVNQDRPVSGAGATWTEWSDHDAYITPTLTAGIDDRPPDSATTARRQYEVTLTPTGRDGWNGEPEHQSVFVTLTKDPQEVTAWAVDEVQVG